MQKQLLIILSLSLSISSVFPADEVLMKVHRSPVSYNQVLEYLNKSPYNVDEPLPTIKAQMFKFMLTKGLSSFVEKRSHDVLKQGIDVRDEGENKPIHPMGVGASGVFTTFNNQYSGVLSNSSVPVVSRISLSQPYPYKFKKDLLGRNKQMRRSVSMAIKVFNSQSLDEKVVTANAVFQNDLNGEYLENFLDGVLTNQPDLDITKIRHSYELITLMGVAKAAFASPNDRIKGAPFINPQIRPVHQLAEAGVDDPAKVKTPIWLKLQISKDTKIIPADDFRLEVYKTIKNAPLRYQVFAANELDEKGKIIWEEIGELVFDQVYLTAGVDQNVLFHHSGLRSDFTGEIILPPRVPLPVRVE